MNIKNKVTDFYNTLYSNKNASKTALIQLWLRERELKNILKLIRKEDVVLDIGCGKGEPSFLVSKKAKRVLGLDISAEAIHAANKRKRDTNVKNCSFIVGDIDNLKYNKNSFDFILCLGIFEYFPSIDKHLKIISRILKPGGKLYFHVWNDESILVKIKKILRVLDKNKAFRRSFFTASEVKRVLEKNGFSLEDYYGQIIVDKPFKILKILNIKLKNKDIFNKTEDIGKINFFARFLAENIVFISKKI